jgi:hypothetical protein
MRVLMVSDVYFPRVNGVSTSIETFRKTLHWMGVEVRLVVPRYGEEAAEPGIIRVAGRPLPGDPEDRLVGWRSMHREVLAAAQDCDLIHIQTPFIAHYAGLKAARTLGLPVSPPTTPCLKSISSTTRRSFLPHGCAVRHGHFRGVSAMHSMASSCRRPRCANAWAATA